MENETPEKVVTTSGVKTEIDLLLEEAQKLRPASRRRLGTTPRWFIRVTKAGGHEYQQLCRHIYVDGTRRLQVAKVKWPEDTERHCRSNAKIA